MTVDVTSKAEHGQLAFELIVEMKNSLLAQTKDIESLNRINADFTAIADHIQKATNARLTMPESIGKSTTEEISSIALAVRRMRGFITGQLQSNTWSLTIPRQNSRLTNKVDMQTYDHMATILHGEKTYYFCIGLKGRYILSDSIYWNQIQ